jgi:16S rRNA (cytidine1402-2'-O)-methyltransferase
MSGSPEGNEGDGERAQLYVVATPIGNLEDVTLRALRVLRNAPVIAAEDTRHTARLLDHHGIPRQAVSLHRHNEQAMAQKVIGWLSEGKSVALVSDAGTPGISDPGAVVVSKARAAGYRVTPIPGASALAAAVSASGLDADGVLFLGFLPATGQARRKVLAPHAHAPYALVLYEAPHRVVECIEDLASLLGDRRLVIARELTKVFESIHECALVEAADWLGGDPNRVRGEFVLIVSGSATQPPEDWESVLSALMAELPLAQAVRLTCEITGVKKKPVYDRALEKKNAS